MPAQRPLSTPISPLKPGRERPDCGHSFPDYGDTMPAAKPPISAQKPCELQDELTSFIRDWARQFYGADAIVRNYGTDPKSLRIHVETSNRDSLTRYDLLGALLTRLEHTPHIEITLRGSKARGDAKIAYRQGQII